MSGVVLRCPNCGTTRAAPGECEACHEAEVSYYCTNHTPGRWLEKRECSQCGARFGDPVRSPTPVPVPSRPAPPPLPPRAAPPPRPSLRRAPRPRVDDDAWGRGPRPFPSDEEPVDADIDPGTDRRVDPRVPGADPRAELLARWQEMLRAAGRGRVRREATRPDLDVTPIARGVGGCLLRLVFLVVFFIIAMAAAMLLFGGSMFQVIGY